MKQLRQLTLFNLQEVESVPSNPVHDPYWDELEQEEFLETTEINLLNSSSALESLTLEQISCDSCQDEYEIVASSNKRHTLTLTNRRSEAAPEQTDDVREQFYTEEEISEDAPEHRPVVREQIFKPTAPEHTHWAEKYWVSRRGAKHLYYRYCWMQGRKIHHCHIPGGCTTSPTSIARYHAVREAIASGYSPVEIKELIASFKP